MHQTSTHDYRPAGGDPLPDGPVLVAATKDTHGVHITFPWVTYPADTTEAALRQVAEETGEHLAIVREVRNAMEACNEETVIEARIERDQAGISGSFFRDLVDAVRCSSPTLDRPAPGPVNAAVALAGDPYMVELLTRYITRREGIEYVSPGAGGAPQYPQIEGIRGTVREFLWDVVSKMAARASLPCVYVGGTYDNPTVCREARADEGRLLHCPGHAEMIHAGIPGLPLARETVIAEQQTNGGTGGDRWEQDELTEQTPDPEDGAA